MRNQAIVAINRERITVTPGIWRLDDLLALIKKPIPEGHDLWRVVPAAPDEKIEGETINVFNGLRLFSFPRYVNNSAGTDA